MAARKSERLLNLLILLLVQRRPIPKGRIRQLLYPDSGPQGFEKMFERDKEELRALGVPIQVSQTDPLFEDEVGYWIPADEFALPDVELTPEEAAVVGLASRAWRDAGMARTTTAALRKLSAAGVDVDRTALDIAQPHGVADEPAFATCWEAVRERRAVEFDYILSGETEVRRRHLQPWGVVRYAGRWYVVGHDTDRGAERVFRLSRVQGDVQQVGRAGAYEIPPETDVRAVAHRLAPRPIAERAVLLVRQGAGHALRRTAVSVTEDVPGPDTASGWDKVELHRPHEGLVDDVLSHGPDAVLVEPAGLRARLVERLGAVVDGSRR